MTELQIDEIECIRELRTTRVHFLKRQTGTVEYYGRRIFFDIKSSKASVREQLVIIPETYLIFAYPVKVRF